MPAPRDFNPLPALGGADIGGVDQCYFAILQSLLGDGAHEIEGVGAHGLIVLVVRNERTREIRRNDLCLLEPPPRERAFTGARCAYQHNETEIRKVDDKLSHSREAPKVGTCIGIGAKLQSLDCCACRSLLRTHGEPPLISRLPHFTRQIERRLVLADERVAARLPRKEPLLLSRPKQLECREVPVAPAVTAI